jgi:hypothetical protein
MQRSSAADGALAGRFSGMPRKPRRSDQPAPPNEGRIELGSNHNHKRPANADLSMGDTGLELQPHDVLGPALASERGSGALSSSQIRSNW